MLTPARGISSLLVIPMVLCDFSGGMWCGWKFLAKFAAWMAAGGAAGGGRL